MSADPGSLGGGRATAVGLAALTLVVVGTVVGGVRAGAMLRATRDDVVARLELADLELRFAPVARGATALPALPPGVTRLEERALALARLSVGALTDLPTLVRVLPASGPPRLDAWELRAGGRYPGPTEAAAVIDRSLADLHGVRVGDRLTLTVDGETRVLPVVGVALSPEHLLAPVHPAYGLPLRGSAGVVGVSEAATAGLPRAGQVNSLLVRMTADADPDQVERALRAVLPVSVTESLPRAQEPGLRFTAFLLTQFDLYLPTVVAAFAGVALLLLALLAARRVDRRRREIGVRLALGHGPLSIARAFVGLPLGATAIGALLGALLSGPVAQRTAAAWAASMGYPPLVDPGLPAGAALGAAGLCLLTCAAAALLPALWLSWRSPALLLREGALSATRRVGPVARGFTRLAEGLRLAPALVLAVAGVARRRRETWAAIAGVTLSVALVLTFASVHLSHRLEAEAALERWTLSATVHLRTPVATPALAALAAPLQGRPEALVTGPVRVVGARAPSSRRLLGVEMGAWLAAQPLAEGRSFAGPEAAEALVDVWLARSDGLALGDRVTLYPAPDAPEGETVTIVGVLDGMSMGRLVVPLTTAQRLYGLRGLATGFLVDSPLPEADLAAAVRAVPGAEVALTRGRALAQVEAAFSGSLRVLMLALITAIAVALLVLAVTAVQDDHDRGPEVALLLALGWRRRSLALVTLGEVLARGVPALLLGGLLAYPCARAFLAQVEQVNGYRVALHLPLDLLLACLGPGLLLLPLAAMPAWVRLRGAPPAAALLALGEAP